MKSLLKSIRRHVERFIFCALFRRVHGNPSGWSETQIRRYDAYQTSGLDVARKCWWNQWRLEPWLYIWRHIIQLEYIDSQNRKPFLTNSRYLISNTIMVYTPGHIGDYIHAQYLLRALKKKNPESHLLHVTGPWSRSLAEKHSEADEVMYYAPQLAQYHRNDLRYRISMQEERRQLGALRKRHPRALFIASYTGPSELLFALAVSAGTTHMFGPEQFVFEMPGLRWTPFDAETHHVQRLLNLMDDPAKAENATWSWPVEKADVEDVHRKLDELGVEGRGQGAEGRGRPPSSRSKRSRTSEDLRSATRGRMSPLIAVAPGAGWEGKIWPEDRYTELVNRLLAETDVHVLFVGSTDEHDLIERIRNRIDQTTWNLAGKFKLGQLPAFFSLCDLLVTNDNGALHLAAAVGTPTVALYGPTDPEVWGAGGEGQGAKGGGQRAEDRGQRAEDRGQRTEGRGQSAEGGGQRAEGGGQRAEDRAELTTNNSQLTTNHMALRGECDCAGCIPWHPKAQCADGLKCMKAISVDAVLAAVIELMRTEDRRQKTEDGRQRTEDGRQRTEDGGQRAEDRGQRTEGRGQRTEDRGQRAEDGGLRTEDGGQKTEDGRRKTENRGGER